MDSRPTGSDELVLVQTDTLSFVIKGSASHPDFQGTVIHDDVSHLKLWCAEPCELSILGEPVPAAAGTVATIPLFYEQQRYEIVIEPYKTVIEPDKKDIESDKPVEFWHDNFNIRNKVTRVGRKSQTLSGVINFGNDIGLSDLVIRKGGCDWLRMTIEVFPSKINYRDDYLAIVSDVTTEVYNLVFDFLKSTYSDFALSSATNSSPVEFFSIIRKIYDEFVRAADIITANPHHLLETYHEVMPGYKVRRTDSRSLRWIENHPEHAARIAGGIAVDRTLGVRKQVTYDTRENRLAKYILQATMLRLRDFKKRYQNIQRNADETVLSQLDAMMNGINRRISGTFLRNIESKQASSGMSLVFSMAPGYRDLYKYYLMLQHGLSLTGDVFNISVKDIAVLYEYWCFIKLNSLMKDRYQLISQDVIKVQGNGLFVALVKGQGSRVKYRNPKNGEIITLSYNPKETELPTVTQRPDNVLTLEKKGAQTDYSYVFDAKYRINPALPGTDYYATISPDPGPEVGDINTMHRYRDAIVYSSEASPMERTMFGAYVLFPYSNETRYRKHRFFKSIDAVNIGGLPFLPSATDLVKEMLDDLINDSPESAFERATLPKGIERKLLKVDWSKRDVMVGTVRNKEQLQANVQYRFYHIPKSAVSESQLPIHYIALYEAGVGVCRYGEVETTETVIRSNITELPKADSSLYYRFNVKEWVQLKKPIMAKESGPHTHWYTNLFLIQHAAEVPELLLRSEENYRMYTELKRRLNAITINENENSAGFEIGDARVVFDEGKICIMKDGKIVTECGVTEFLKAPNANFKRMMHDMSVTT